MRNIPLHATPRQAARDHRSAKSQIGASWAAGGPASSRPFGWKFVLLLGCVAAGLLLASGVLTALPTLYEAESRVLLNDAADQQNEVIAHSPEVALKVVFDLHLDRDPDFNRAPWQPPVELLQARSWLEEVTGWHLPPIGTGKRTDMAARFWERVDVEYLGRSSRVMEIHARSGDPQMAASMANTLARSTQGGSLIAPAAPPAAASFPPTMTILVAGGLLGLTFGLIVIGAMAVNPRQFSRAEDVETSSGLPVIAVVPQLDDPAGVLAQVLRDPGSPYAGALRKLYEKLHSERWKQTPKVIAICSALPGEGRTTLAASLGRLLASEGGRILLVDCDWRNPELHKMFRLPNDTGLTSLLVDPHITLDDVIHTDALSGLDIITAGRRNRAAVHKLISEPMRKLLATLAGGYDLVLLDMPPVLAADETLLLSCVVDKLIFAIRWQHTLQRKATDAMEKILGARGDVVGVVFTRVDMDRYRKSQLNNAG
ncbi:MAG TPA: AAA family ATPase [Magnetospirillaceae bacterium]|nr:AAA family ATPase [Magnetospirillaceae bacterium]